MTLNLSKYCVNTESEEWITGNVTSLKTDALARFGWESVWIVESRVFFFGNEHMIYNCSASVVMFRSHVLYCKIDLTEFSAKKIISSSRLDSCELWFSFDWLFWTNLNLCRNIHRIFQYISACGSDWLIFQRFLWIKTFKSNFVYKLVNHKQVTDWFNLKIDKEINRVYGLKGSFKRILIKCY